jgi:iron complex outermembrane receptor protein
MSQRGGLLWSTASLLTLVLAGGAQAQSSGDQIGVEEIVVTAQKRSENIQAVPISITAFTQQRLEARGFSGVKDLNGLAPGLQIKGADAGANPKIFVRGIGVNDVNPSSPSSVGVYADGVYIGSPIAQSGQFYDLERIEVLRGPQGTLYGRNTTGGAINIIGKRPTFTARGDASLEAGSYGYVRVEGGVGGPLVDEKLAFRLAALGVRSDGSTYNRVTGDDVNKQDRVSVRLSVLYEATPELEVLAQIHGGRNSGDSRSLQTRPLKANTAAAVGDNGYCAPAYYESGQCTDLIGYADKDGNPYAGDYDLEGKDPVRLYGGSVNARWSGATVSLVSITAFDGAERRHARVDIDGGPNSVLASDYAVLQQQFSQELRLQSEDAERFKWVIGGYYLHDHLKSDSFIDQLRVLRPLFTRPSNPSGASLASSVGVFGFPYTQKTASYALFGQVDYNLTDALTLTGGLRWSQDDKDLAYRSTFERTTTLLTYQGSKAFVSVSGRLGLSYKLTTDANLYATFNRGYKSGGYFGGFTSSLADLVPYDDEAVNAYEAGVKTTWLGRRLRLNASTFYYDYKNLQVYSLVERSGVTASFYNNAASATIYGAELEGSATPLRGLDIGGNLSLLSAKFDEYLSLGQDFSKNTLPSAPKFNLSAYGAYQHPLPYGSLTTNISTSYRSKVYFDTANTERYADGGLWLLDARLGWKAPAGFEVGVWGRNLTDKAYPMEVSTFTSLRFYQYSMGEPRTLGVYLKASF